MQEIRRRLAELIRTKTGVMPRSDDPLASLRIDSLSMAELTVEVERAFGIRVEEDILDVETVAELAEYIEARAVCRY